MGDVEVTTSQEGSQAGVVIQGKPAGVNAPETPAPKKEGGERPAWLPEKFKTVEELAKSYTELEKKMGSQGGDKVEKATTKPEGETLQIEANKAVAKAGLDMKALQEEFTANGQLTPESMKKLADNGITKDQVDTFVRGMKAQRDDYEAKITEGIEGGRETLNQAMEWAREHWTPEQIESFNKAVSLGDPNIGRLAVQGLMSDFSNDDGPHLITSEGPSNEGGDVFQSHAQVQAAMSDPRYEKDPAFRDAVMKKVMRSDYSKFKG